MAYELTEIMPTKISTFMTLNNLTSIPSKSMSTKMQIALSPMKLFVILLFTFLLLLFVRKYFNVAKWNGNNAACNIHSIKYVSNKQLNKINIDTNAEEANAIENVDNDRQHICSSEFESKVDINEHQNEYNKNRNNIVDRIKGRVYRWTALMSERYRNLDESN